MHNVICNLLTWMLLNTCESLRNELLEVRHMRLLCVIRATLEVTHDVALERYCICSCVSVTVQFPHANEILRIKIFQMTS